MCVCVQSGTIKGDPLLEGTITPPLCSVASSYIIFIYIVYPHTHTHTYFSCLLFLIYVDKYTAHTMDSMHQKAKNWPSLRRKWLLWFIAILPTSFSLLDISNRDPQKKRGATTKHRERESKKDLSFFFFGWKKKSHYEGKKRRRKKGEYIQQN